MRTLIRGVGELCITAGIVLLFFVTYELWGTGRYTREQQDMLSRQLAQDWDRPRVTTEKVRLGHGMALLRIPRFGEKFRYVVVEGVDLGDLRKGPGHYPGTALPGEKGNFVVSGHRTTYSAPFNRVDELRDGDRILVDTRAGQFVYKVTDKKIVSPREVNVTASVPFHPKQKAAKRLITLTTCHPKFSAAKRLIIFGELVRELPRAQAGSPAHGSGGGT
ncbi:class E sortase [Actinomadura sp. HBU206391]|uniref:class E sortase n=1 Tax=Actinomadura sp. HBU206391 TaxID=2731692 RepID=UPI00164FDC13|nr:class E sortase [Actinomadura sp. HBU206391]MBC6457171.1 class E sortase [Actinomadura sp. HBU206391]